MTLVNQLLPELEEVSAQLSLMIFTQIQQLKLKNLFLEKIKLEKLENIYILKLIIYLLLRLIFNNKKLLMTQLEKICKIGLIKMFKFKLKCFLQMLNLKLRELSKIILDS